MKKTLLIPLLLFSTCVQAQTLSSSGNLNKLSKKLRGTNPSIQESLQMEDAEKAGQTELFLQGKISEYTHSADFRIKFKY